MEVTWKKLDSGYYRIQGEGPCNWAQVPPDWRYWDGLEEHAFPEACKDFFDSVYKMLEEGGRNERP